MKYDKTDYALGFLCEFFCRQKGKFKLVAISSCGQFRNRITIDLTNTHLAFNKMQKFITKNIDHCEIYFTPISLDTSTQNNSFTPSMWCHLNLKKISTGIDGRVNYFKGKRDILRSIHDFYPSPSFVVETGDAYQLYWVFNFYSQDKTHEFKKYESVMKGICKELKGDFDYINISQLMKLPHTFNFKLCEEIKELQSFFEQIGIQRFNIMDFEKYFNTENHENDMEEP